MASSVPPGESRLAFQPDCISVSTIEMCIKGVKGRNLTDDDIATVQDLAKETVLHLLEKDSPSRELGNATVVLLQEMICRSPYWEAFEGEKGTLLMFETFVKSWDKLGMSYQGIRYLVSLHVSGG